MRTWWLVASIAFTVLCLLETSQAQRQFGRRRDSTPPTNLLNSIFRNRPGITNQKRMIPRFPNYIQPRGSTTRLVSQSDVELEFDESQKTNLSLGLKWRFKSGKTVTRYILRMEMFVYSFSFTLPIFDTTNINPSEFDAKKFTRRQEVPKNAGLSNINNCITKCIESQDCNIYMYSPVGKCVLYTYDFTPRNDSNSHHDSEEDYQDNSHLLAEIQSEEIHDSFIQECQTAGVNHSLNCQKISFPTQTNIYISPGKQYKLWLKLRSESEWSDFITKEFKYDPSIDIKVTGEVIPGKDVTLECSTDLNPSRHSGIKWTGYSNNQTLELKPLTWKHLADTFECEIMTSSMQTFKKRYKLNMTLVSKQPSINLKIIPSVEDAQVELRWSFNTSNDQMNPEKIKIMYSVNEQPFMIIKKRSMFQASNYDYSNLYGVTEVTTNSEEECLLQCLDDSTCNHYVYYVYLKKDNCELSKSDLSSLRRSCSFNKVCSRLMPYESLFSNNTARVAIMPNVTYRFKLQIKDKYLGWGEEVVSEPVRVPLEIKLEQILSVDKKSYELECSTNVKTSHRQVLMWFKDGYNLYWRTDMPFKANTSDDESSSRLAFKLDTNRRFDFNGQYMCVVRFTGSDVNKIFEITSYSASLNISHFGADTRTTLNYTKTFQNFSIPIVPSSFMVIPCQVKGSPIDSLTWLLNGKSIGKSVNVHIDLDEQIGNGQKASLYLILNKTMPVSKFECVLNGNVTIRTHFIELFDEKPEYEAKVDLSELNSLRVRIDMVEKKRQTSRLAESLRQFAKPLKLSIMYVENGSFVEPGAVYFAPRVFSLSELKNQSELDDATNIGSIAPRKHKGSISCKLWCFMFSYCASYEYHNWDESCRLFHSESHDTLFQQVLGTMNQTYGLPDGSMLIEFPYFDSRVLAEQEGSWAKVIKPEEDEVCWSKSRSGTWHLAHPTGSFDHADEEASCRNKLPPFNSTYVFDKLVPGTSYQFKIEVANIFGKSDPFFTNNITVPFQLNPIVERNETRDGKEAYVLTCSTPLIATSRLKFKWYKEETLIDDGHKEELKKRTSQEEAKYTSELRLEGPRHLFDGIYECELTFQGSTEFSSIKTNASYIMTTKMAPSYQTYPDKVKNVTEKHGYEETCDVSGLPLPNVEWRLNGVLVSNSFKSISSFPHRPFFMNHLYSATLIKSKLYVPSMTQEAQGRYQCFLVNDDGSQINVRNVTLQMVPADEASRNTIIPGRSSFSARFLIGLLVIVVAAAVVSSLFIYYKKKRTDQSVMLRYNNLNSGMTESTQQLNLNQEQEEHEQEEGQGL